MNVPDVAARLRAVFERPPRAAISDVIALISASVREQLEEPAAYLVPLEKEVLDCYEHSVDYTSVVHLEAFLSVLHCLQPVLPASSVITWFDHLRPVLREPQLGLETKRNLQALIASALNESTHGAESRSREFRRRIVELYIFDASSGTDVEDIIEDADQNAMDADVRRTWKQNLESILEIDLFTSPNESFARLNASFAEAGARYPITALVARVFSSKTRLPPVEALSKSPILSSILTSALVDKSTPLFEREMLTLVLIMPYMAVYTPKRLREILPSLLAIIARALCWKYHPPLHNGEIGDETPDVSTPTSVDIRNEGLKAIFLDKNDEDISHDGLIDKDAVRPKTDLGWAVVESHLSQFGLPIDHTVFFTFVYGLFPCNTIAFLRRPVVHLQELDFDGPFSVPLSSILDVQEIRSRSIPLVRSHAFHPAILFRDAKSELSDPRSWAPATRVSSAQLTNDTSDVARLVSECIRLDTTHAGKDPSDIVRSSLLREGISWEEPLRTTSFSRIRDMMGPGWGSDLESFGSTPRARGREKLHPLLPHSGNSPVNEVLEEGRQRQDSPSEASESLLFSRQVHHSCSHERLSAPLSQSSSDRIHGLGLPAHYLHSNSGTRSPLAHPSPLALSSIPLPSDLSGESDAEEPSERLYSQAVTVPFEDSGASEGLQGDEEKVKPPTPPILPSGAASGSPPPPLAASAARALEVLQHENTRLRDLNQLAHWMCSEMKAHVVRLHRDRIVITGEELERQSLHNRLRDYKRRLQATQEDNRKMKSQAAKAESQNKHWVDQLTQRLSAFRKEKISWTNEAVKLRGDINDVEMTLQAREALHSETLIKYTELSTKMEFLQPKIGQMEENERQLDRLRKAVTLDESPDVRALREDSNALRGALDTIEKLKLMVASLEHANDKLQQMVNDQTAEVRHVEQRLMVALKATALGPRNRSPQGRYRPLSQSFNAQQMRQSPVATPDDRQLKMMAENTELKEDVESLNVMVEMLRADAERVRIRQDNSGRRKSVSGIPSVYATMAPPSPPEVLASDLGEL